MNTAIQKLGSALLCACLLLSNCISSPACAPRFTEAVFSYSLHPDFPYTYFAQGDLGIVKPTYARAYLVTAYLYMMDKPLTKEAQDIFMNEWATRSVHTWLADESVDRADPVKAWQKARSEVVTGSVEIRTNRRVKQDAESWSGYTNCQGIAFETATKTLKERISKYGIHSQQVKDWVTGQDHVFCHCGGPEYNYKTKKFAEEGPFPEPPADAADPTIKADRAYQIACADFYAQRFDQAVTEFTAIAGDTTSPWRTYGLYLAARALTRKATLATPLNLEALHSATEVLHTVLKDQTLSPLRESAQALLDFVTCQIDPTAEASQLARDIVDTSKAGALSKNLASYVYLLDTLGPDYGNPGSADHNAALKALRSDDLTDWITTYQNWKVVDQKGRSLAQWQQHHSIPWLIAALSQCAIGAPEEKELLEAAEAVPIKSRAYNTVSYFLIQHLLQNKQKTRAEKRLSIVLSQQLSPSARNDFENFQMLLEPTITEFTKLAVRKPAYYFADYNYDELPDNVKTLIYAANYPPVRDACFDYEAGNILNGKVPLDLLKQATTVASTPKKSRFDLAQAVFVRAVLLGREDIALSLVPLLKSLRPDMSALFTSYQSAGSSQEKQFTACYIILKNPGMRPYVNPGAPREVDYGRIENYGDNWWESSGLNRQYRASNDQAQAVKTRQPQFLTAASLQAASDEIRRIKSLGEAPNYLTRKVLEYANLHPGDPRIAEALHYCVKSTKFGSTTAATTKLSQQAFTVLHKRYNESKWAKQTPIYF